MGIRTYRHDNSNSSLCNYAKVIWQHPACYSKYQVNFMPNKIKIFKAQSSDSLEEEFNKWMLEGNKTIMHMAFQPLVNPNDKKANYALLVFYRE